MGAISRTGTTYTCGAHEVTHGFSVVRFTRSLVLCLMFCRTLFAFLSIVLSVLKFAHSDCPFGIFKLFILLFYYQYLIPTNWWPFNYGLPRRSLTDNKAVNIINWLCSLDLILIFGVLAPLSAIFQLYHGEQF